MTSYDHWKTTEPEPLIDPPVPGDVLEQVEKLEADIGELLGPAEHSEQARRQITALHNEINELLRGYAQ